MRSEPLPRKTPASGAALSVYRPPVLAGTDSVAPQRLHPYTSTCATRQENSISCCLQIGHMGIGRVGSATLQFSIS